MAPQYPYPAEKFSLVGRVTKSHGLKGEIKVLPLQGDTEEFINYGRVALVATDGRMTELLDIVRWRAQGRQVILKLATIDNKSEADLTAGMGVLCNRHDLPVAAENSSGRELVGLEMLTVDNKVVGIIEAVSHTGAHPIMIVRDNGEEFLIPLVDDIIVDRQGSRLIIDPPPGLLDINRA
ncbi:MAG: ribosome maturation factor RimM [Desulfofustis sp.]|nr:ribosome maturation factor RimM [Desulfofustis sp.]MBT8354924.1 ribosome maturation factor RimM [Desulfofustis sp.]NNF45875.1 16S rRNA processing protein RimM [Desulfofustis sp.]NNK56244.1 16S rRNA processing protein RimM [Desulfofustis sp.]RZW26919.1 MAG: 16S rRNA processing protein RimM [Desulfobulbaceae bacterium]